MIQQNYCIFDMDGTLVDSMHLWNNLGRDYLLSQGVQAPDELLWMTVTMTMIESASYFMETAHLPGPPEAIVAGMEQVMESHYRHDVCLKPGVLEYLSVLKTRGTQICVATATALPLATACLERLGLIPYLDFISSCETIGKGKNHPDIFLNCAQRLGAQPHEIAVFDDALYALETAKKAGFYTVGVFDENGADKWPYIQTLCHQLVTDWRQLL